MERDDGIAKALKSLQYVKAPLRYWQVPSQKRQIDNPLPTLPDADLDTNTRRRASTLLCFLQRVELL